MAYHVKVWSNRVAKVKIIKRSIIYCLMILGFLGITSSVMATRFQLKPAGDNLYGEIQVTTVQSDDEFSKIARRYDVGYYELVEANPEVDPDHLIPGTVLIIPTQFLLPPVHREGIVINLANMRLY